MSLLSSLLQYSLSITLRVIFPININKPMLFPTLSFHIENRKFQLLFLVLKISYLYSWPNLPLISHYVLTMLSLWFCLRLLFSCAFKWLSYCFALGWLWASLHVSFIDRSSWSSNIKESIILFSITVLWFFELYLSLSDVFLCACVFAYFSRNFYYIFSA